MDIYVEDWGEINDDLPSNAQSAMSENNLALEEVRGCI